MDNAKPTVEQVLTSRLADRAGIESGPRPQDFTVRLTRAEDVPAAVAELCAAGLALAMLVATDEEATAERDLKVRYIFEPGADCGRSLTLSSLL